MAWLLAASCAGLAAAPPNVLLIVNRQSPDSVAIGQYYSQRRDIPAARICHLSTSVQETVGRGVYDREIEQPILQCLARLPRSTPVHYLVTTLGLPLRIAGTEGQMGTTASVDSELAALRLRQLGRASHTEGPVANPLFQRSEAPFDPVQFPVYLVARLAAYSASTVKRMIDHGLEARNRGRVVLDSTGTTKLGDRWIASAALQLGQSRVTLDETAEVTTGQRDVIGYCSWGSNDPLHRRRFVGFAWLPGSVATEFVSTNARTLIRPPASWQLGIWKIASTYYADSPQTLSADYLEEGASAATGHTDEPYLAYTPRPDLLFPAYLNGRTLGESFYLSIPALSWMNVLLGDPLMRLGK